MEKKSLKRPSALYFVLVLLMLCMLGSCSGGGAAGSTEDAFYGREASDMSGYKGLEGYDKEIMFVDMTVDEMDKMMSDKKSFVVFFSYENCPYCNRLIPYLNDAAIEAGVHVGYINTRKNPEWQSNMDIDGYDTVVKRFGDYLDEDEDGKEHLYVPDVYFIKNGKVAARHDGVTEGADDPDQALSSKQEKQIMKDLAEEFGSLH